MEGGRGTWEEQELARMGNAAHLARRDAQILREPLPHHEGWELLHREEVFEDGERLLADVPARQAAADGRQGEAVGHARRQREGHRIGVAGELVGHGVRARVAGPAESAGLLAGSTC